MPLQKIKLTEMMKRIQLRIVHERPKKRSPPLSPTSTLTTFKIERDESDDELCTLTGSSSSNPQGNIPPDVPKGFFVVYVGDECKRYVIPLKHLKHQAFLSLLSRAEEEFGYGGVGALRLPCDTAYFDQLLCVLRDSACFVINLCS